MNTRVGELVVGGGVRVCECVRARVRVYSISLRVPQLHLARRRALCWHLDHLLYVLMCLAALMYSALVTIAGR